VSESFPPPGGDQPEILDSTSTEVLPAAPAQEPKGRKGLLLGALGVLGVGIVGGGAFAAYQFFSAGTEATDSLPANTLFSVSVDADPTGEQKIAAYQFLRKFPGIADEMNLDGDADPRQELLDALLEDSDCDLNFDKDFSPWLGNSVAVAGVPSDNEYGVDLVGVIEVTEASIAKDSLAEILDCGDTNSPVDFAVGENFAVIAQTENIAQGVIDDSAESSLTDSPSFDRWVGEAGDPGFMLMYAAPEAGEWYADHMDDLASLSTEDENLGDTISPEMPEEVLDQMRDFEGAAYVIRFADEGMELEGASGSAGFSEISALSESGSGSATELPDDTLAALSISLADGWLTKTTEYFISLSGDESVTVDDLFAEAEAETGLELPEDVETLLGSETVLAVGGDFDPEALANSTAVPDDLGVGLHIQGDPAEIEDVLDKLRAQLPAESLAVLDSSEGEGEIAIGPDSDYRDQLLDEGKLGEASSFTGVVDNGENASVLLFVDFNAGDDWLATLLEGDDTAVENVKPLKSVGMSGWVQDGVQHVKLRLSTD
jgi:hypothetical protein